MTFIKKYDFIENIKIKQDSKLVIRNEKFLIKIKVTITSFEENLYYLLWARVAGSTLLFLAGKTDITWDYSLSYNFLNYLAFEDF